MPLVSPSECALSVLQAAAGIAGWDQQRMMEALGLYQDACPKTAFRAWVAGTSPMQLLSGGYEKTHPATGRISRMVAPDALAQAWLYSLTPAQLKEFTGFDVMGPKARLGVGGLLAVCCSAWRTATDAAQVQLHPLTSGCTSAIALKMWKSVFF